VKAAGIFSLILLGTLPAVHAPRARAEDSSSDLLAQARTLYREGSYFSAARYAFSATTGESDRADAEAYSWVMLGLARAGLYQAASYFFIWTL
jgi:Flp pilus assembly protein TadD